MVVNERPYQHRASHTAYHFTRSPLGNDHQVMRMFFYHDGANNGTCLTAPPQDQPRIVDLWSRLGRLDLVARAAAQQHSLMDDRGKTRYALPTANPVPGSRVSGQLIEAAIRGERSCAMLVATGGPRV